GGAVRLARPLASRGMPVVGVLSHCAEAGELAAATTSSVSMDAIPDRCMRRAYRIIAALMRRKVPLQLLCALGVAVLARVLTAQPPAADEVARGRGLYQTRCADCHGIDAKGVHGPDLTMLYFANGANDARVLDTIRRGVPGTEMPASNAPDQELRAIV